MMNPMEMISLLKGRNPEELVMSMIKITILMIQLLMN